MSAFNVKILYASEDFPTTYAVEVTDVISKQSWIVHRRFREMRALKKALGKTNLVCPSRKLRNTEEVICRRKRELEIFLSRVILIPGIYLQPAAQQFFEFNHVDMTECTPDLARTCSESSNDSTATISTTCSGASSASSYSKSERSVAESLVMSLATFCSVE